MTMKSRISQERTTITKKWSIVESIEISNQMIIRKTNKQTIIRNSLIKETISKIRILSKERIKKEVEDSGDRVNRRKLSLLWHSR